MLLCIVGDYCIGLEPSGSTVIGRFASSGWLTIADWRIAVSNLTGTVGSILYAIGAVAFSRFLLERTEDKQDPKDKMWVYLYTAGLGIGCVSFMYFHIACVGLIQHFKVLYEVTGGNAQQATDSWIKMLLPEIIPFGILFIGFDVLTSVAWIALIVREIIPVPKRWILAAPIIMAGIGTLPDLLPLPVSGINRDLRALAGCLCSYAG